MHGYSGENLEQGPKLVCRTPANPHFSAALNSIQKRQDMIVKKHRNEIITGVVIVAVLVTAFIIGGSRIDPRPMTQGNSEFGIGNSELADDAVQIGSEGTGGNSEFGIRNSELTVTEPGVPVTQGNSELTVTEPGAMNNSELTVTEPGAANSPGEAAEPKGPDNPGGPAQSKEPEKPVEPEDSEKPAEPGELTVMLVISVATVLDNMDRLAEGRAGLIPPDGIIFSGSVVFYEGESVFNVVQRETKRNRIHMESVNTPIYNSTYIEGINNIYEFDVGERSGWMYSVNGTFPNFGSSRYLLQDGDVIRWLYTCDRGVDIGGGAAADYYGFG